MRIVQVLPSNPQDLLAVTFFLGDFTNSMFLECCLLRATDSRSACFKEDLLCFECTAIDTLSPCPWGFAGLLICSWERFCLVLLAGSLSERLTYLRPDPGISLSKLLRFGSFLPISLTFYFEERWDMISYDYWSFGYECMGSTKLFGELTKPSGG